LKHQASHDIPWGKYAKHKIASVLKVDPGYVRWLAGLGIEGRKPKTFEHKSWVAMEIILEARTQIIWVCFASVEKWKNFCTSCFKNLVR